MREHLQRALDLTPEQAAKIAPIVDATSAKLEAIRVETAERVRNVMEESKREISPQLTPEQREKLQKLKQRHIKILRHHGFGPLPSDSPHPPP